MTISRQTKFLFLLSFLGVVSVFLTGVFSDISMGDEPYHYRYARYIYETGNRPVYDPLVHASPVSRRRFMVEPLWHYVLAGIWTITGRATQWIAQAYQAIWYFLLIFFTYLLSRHLRGEENAICSSLIIMTMPMVAAFSVMLYIDIAIATIAALSFYTLFKKKYFWVGVLMGLMFLTKRNSYFLFPFFVLYILFIDSGKVKKKAANLALFLLPLFFITLPDFLFRYRSLGSIIHHPHIVTPLYEDPSLQITFIHPDNFNENPENLIRYFGIPFYVGLVLYVFNSFRRKMAKIKDDLLILGAVVSYIIFYLYYFKDTLGIRYLSPIFPLLVVISSSGFLQWSRYKKKLVLMFIVLGGLIQIYTALGYTYKERKISPEYRAGYNYIVQNTPTNSTFLTPMAALSLYTGRKSIWHSESSLPEIGYLFWKANEDEVYNILTRYSIDYISVKKSRIFDDSKTDIKDVKNYPLSFIEKFPTFKSLKVIFENETVTIWEVVKDGKNNAH